jgi:transmembrane sensor
VSWAIAAAAVVALAVTLAARVGQTPAGSAWQPAEVVTGAGELATVHLGDGSVARLAPRSRLRILPSANERLLSLDGQAFFAVTRRPDRPFRVRTRDGDAVALGTRFEVATNGRGLRLIVLDGRVALSDSTGTAQMEVNSGEASGVVDGRLSRTSVVANRDAVGAWMGRFLAFQSTPLPRVAAEIERMYGVRVVVEDPDLYSETVSASFTDEPFRQVVGVVCDVIGGRCVVTDSMVTFRR